MEGNLRKNRREKKMFKARNGHYMSLGELLSRQRTDDKKAAERRLLKEISWAKTPQGQRYLKKVLKR